MTESMVTTIDNPFNFFTQFDEWLAFDESKGYYTCELLASKAKTSDELSEQEENDAIEVGIDEIIKEDVLGIYTKVFREN